MNTKNNGTVIGRIVADANVPQTANAAGGCVVRFTVAVDNSYKNSDGTRGTQFIPFSLYQRDAANLSGIVSRIKKGTLVAVNYEIHCGGQYTDKNGETKYANTPELMVQSIDLLESAAATAARAKAQQAKATAKA